MYRTLNDLPQDTRNNVSEMLQKRLADAIDLHLQVKQAHWNIRGPHFISLHRLFDRIHEDTERNVDLVAERIAQFGETAEGTVEAVHGNSSLPEYPLTITEELDHLESLARSLSAFGKSIRLAIAQADDWQDRGTADILTEISRNIDKNLWLVESHFAEQIAEQDESVKGAA